jgi:hypothetical protein
LNVAAVTFYLVYLVRLKNGTVHLTAARCQSRLRYSLYNRKGEVWIPSGRTSGPAGARATAECAPDWGDAGVGACYAYAAGHQTRDGGFCYYAYAPWRVEEPNAPDTYAAIAICRILGRPVPRRGSCTAWLRAQQDFSGGYPSLLIGWCVLKALKLLDAKPMRDPRNYLHKAGQALFAADGSGGSLRGWLANALRWIEAAMDYRIVASTQIRQGIAARLARLRSGDGGYGAPGANLPETAEAAALAAAAALPQDQALLGYTRQCEHPPFGFTITPLAAASGLECQHAGLQLLRRFRQHPRDPALIKSYVKSCQTASGGFGRVPGAIPRLDDSLRALEILAMLTRSESAAGDLLK